MPKSWKTTARESHSDSVRLAQDLAAKEASCLCCLFSCLFRQCFSWWPWSAPAQYRRNNQVKQKSAFLAEYLQRMARDRAVLQFAKGYALFW